MSASYVPPRGRKGLWEALARATSGATAVAVDELDDEGAELVAVADIADRAHLGYLARLAAPTDGASGTATADVVDLATFRARRG